MGCGKIYVDETINATYFNSKFAIDPGGYKYITRNIQDITTNAEGVREGKFYRSKMTDLHLSEISPNVWQVESQS